MGAGTYSYALHANEFGQVLTEEGKTTLFPLADVVNLCFGKLLDGISSVAEDAKFAIQKRNGTFGCTRIFVT